MPGTRGMVWSPTMSRQKLVLFAALAAVLLAFCPATEAVEQHRTFYYYMVTDTDGTSAIEQMSSDDASDLKRTHKEQRKEVLKEYTQEKKKWYQVMGKKPYPVSAPMRQKIQKLGRIPSTAKSREKAFEKYSRRINVWDVCVVKDWRGDVAVEVLRRDKKFARRRELLKEYAGALMEWYEEHKDDAKKDKKDAPRKPVISVAKARLTSSELADKWAERLNKKLEKKQADKEDKKEAADD